MEREKLNITRSNFRKRAVKKVNQLFASLNDDNAYSVEDTEEDYHVEHGAVSSSSDEDAEERGEFPSDSHVDEDMNAECWLDAVFAVRHLPLKNKKV